MDREIRDRDFRLTRTEIPLCNWITHVFGGILWDHLYIHLEQKEYRRST